MAHNLNIVNGKAAFYSLRESAWHGLGQVVERPVADSEVLKLAGLDWTAESTGLYRSDMTPVRSHKIIVRSDTKESLGVVGANYESVQNKDLSDWFRGLDGFADVTIETAGALGIGETVWMLARCNGLRFDIKGDEHQGYMTIINGHAGNKKLTLMPTSTRIVCANTMRMALGAGTRQGTLASGWELRHTSNIADNLERIKALYSRTTDSWKATEEVLRMLADKPATSADLTRMFSEPWKAPVENVADELAESESDRASVIRDAREQNLHAIYESGTCQLRGTRNTLFAAYNAVTEYLEHDAPTRVAKGTSKDNIKRAVAMKRFESANFGGRGDDVKTNAYKLALELANA